MKGNILQRISKLETQRLLNKPVEIIEINDGKWDLLVRVKEKKIL